MKPFQTDSPLEGNDAYWDVINCRMLRQSPVKFDEGWYMIRASFEQKLGDHHGILQIIQPEKYAANSDGRFFVKTNTVGCWCGQMAS